MAGKRKLFEGTLRRRLLGTKALRESARGEISKLSPREYEILAYVAQGLMSIDIAVTLGCSRRTVEAHRHRILTKLNVNTAAAVRLAILAAVDEAGGKEIGCDSNA